MGRTSLAQSLIIQLYRKLFVLVKWAVALIGLSVIITIIITLSPYGQKKIGGYLGNVLTSIGEGHCRIGGVILYKLPSIVVYDIDWTYKNKSVFKCDEIDLKVHLTKLLKKRIELDYLVLKDLRVSFNDAYDGWNFLHLFKKDKPKQIEKKPSHKKPKPFPLNAIIVHQLTIRNSEFEMLSNKHLYTLSRTPVNIESKEIRYEKKSSSIDKFQLESSYINLNTAFQLQYQDARPYGSYQVNLSIPDSIIRRYLPSWTDTSLFQLTIDGNHTANGVSADITSIIANQKIRTQLLNPDSKLELVNFSLDVRHLNLKSVFTNLPASDITTTITGTWYDILKKPRCIGDVDLSKSQITPVEDIEAMLKVYYDAQHIQVDGSIKEKRGDLSIELDVTNLFKPIAKLNANVQGTLKNYKQWIPIQEIPDSVQLSIQLQSTGNFIPIENVQFQVSFRKNQVYSIAFDTLAVFGTYHKNVVTIDTLYSKLAHGTLLAKGRYDFDGVLDASGTLNRIQIHTFRNFTKQDSISGLASFNFQTQLSKLSHFNPILKVNGNVTNLSTPWIKVDSVQIQTANFDGKLENIELVLECNSIDSKYTLPSHLQSSIRLQNDSVMFRTLIQNDTITAQVNLKAIWDRQTNHFTIYPDTLFYLTSALPLYLQKSSPIYLTPKSLDWNEFILDTPFGIVSSSFSYDSVGEMKGDLVIDYMDLSSLLSIQPMLKNLMGTTSLKGNWKIDSSHKISADAKIIVKNTGWSDLFIADTIELMSTWNNNSIQWDLSMFRENIEAMKSNGLIIIDDSNHFSLTKIDLKTVEMPSRWFVGMLPPRSIWNGSIQLEFNQVNQEQPKTNIRLLADRLSMPEFGLDHRNVVLKISNVGQQLIIDSAYSKSGKGDLKLVGDIFIKSFLPDCLMVNARARRFQFIKLTNRELMGDLDLAIQGPILKLNLSGKVQLLEAKYDFGGEVKDLEEVYLEEDSAPLFPTTELWKQTSGTVTISAPGNVWVTGAGINAETKMNLVMNKHRDEQFPQLFGSVDIVRGTVTQYGRKLSIQEGSFLFDGDPFDPKIDIKASEETLKRTLNVEISVELSGSAQKPEIVFRGFNANGSAMNELDVVSYLVFGRPTASLLSESNDNESLTERATTTATTTATSQITNLIGQKLGLSLFEYRPGESNATQSTSGEFEVGGYVTDRIFLSAVTPMGSAAFIDRIRAEYQVLPWLRIAASRDADGKQILESYIQTEWGPPPKPKKEEKYEGELQE